MHCKKLFYSVLRQRTFTIRKPFIKAGGHVPRKIIQRSFRLVIIMGFQLTSSVIHIKWRKIPQTTMTEVKLLDTTKAVCQDQFFFSVYISFLDRVIDHQCRKLDENCYSSANLCYKHCSTFTTVNALHCKILG